MSNITAQIANISNIVTRVQTSPQSTVSAVGIQGVQGAQGPQGITGGVNSLVDVDVTNLQDGSLLVYNTISTKWTATTHLNAQDMDAGEF